MTLTERDIRWLKSPAKIQVISHLKNNDPAGSRKAYCKCDQPFGDWVVGCRNCGRRISA